MSLLEWAICDFNPEGMFGVDASIRVFAAGGTVREVRVGKPYHSTGPACSKDGGLLLCALADDRADDRAVAMFSTSDGSVLWTSPRFREINGYCFGYADNLVLISGSIRKHRSEIYEFDVRDGGKPIRETELASRLRRVRSFVFSPD